MKPISLLNLDTLLMNYIVLLSKIFVLNLFVCCHFPDVKHNSYVCQNLVKNDLNTTIWSLITLAFTHLDASNFIQDQSLTITRVKVVKKKKMRRNGKIKFINLVSTEWKCINFGFSLTIRALYCYWFYYFFIFSYPLVECEQFQTICSVIWFPRKLLENQQRDDILIYTCQSQSIMKNQKCNLKKISHFFRDLKKKRILLRRQ